MTHIMQFEDFYYSENQNIFSYCLPFLSNRHQYFFLQFFKSFSCSSLFLFSFSSHPSSALFSHYQPSHFNQAMMSAQVQTSNLTTSEFLSFTMSKPEMLTSLSETYARWKEKIHFQLKVQLTECPEKHKCSINIANNLLP